MPSHTGRIELSRWAVVLGSTARRRRSLGRPARTAATAFHQGRDGNRWDIDIHLVKKIFRNQNIFFGFLRKPKVFFGNQGLFGNQIQKDFFGNQGFFGNQNVYIANQNMQVAGFWSLVKFMNYTFWILKPWHWPLPSCSQSNPGGTWNSFADRFLKALLSCRRRVFLCARSRD